MPPIVMAMPVLVATGPHSSTGGGSDGRPTPASDPTTDDSTSHGAASCGALSHDIRDRHGKCQQQKN